MPPRCASAEAARRVRAGLLVVARHLRVARGAGPRRRGPGPGPRLLADRSGAAAVEFAIAAPVLMLIVYGSIEVGRLLYADHAVAHAARESTRFAMVRSAESENPATDAQIEAVARRATLLDPDRVSVETVYDPDANRGSSVRVRVTYSYTPMMPYVVRAEITLEGQSTKRIVN